ncbi:hypothetical protein [Nocardioides acrostichi]|uniref:Uncharacterized protein n=1 Tax=Nocardioides acrostichi TaxID=2784339 RepID=A0A930V4E3_9ACTN|nr:hypothetical protein [Nocardioides acrostichi]MBF4163530.1 hypothetical protein [Nocardioides acrostichi]
MDVTLPDRRQSLRILGLVKAFIVGAVFAVVAVTASFNALGGTTTAAPSATPTPVQKVDPALVRLMGQHQCSTSGFGDTAIPASALLRTPEGHLELVSFDRGWAAQNGDAPGELVAVCLDRPTSQG